ncbi:uncharacterized protein LOC128855841 [Anastrepha ludens]|uniref:uncharacterized protein LOC128855841 n=1 Tax=Anastrepha ludens TaxID=28586 RepID=UPI0023B1B67C|nr:uncharacterized protein LOC128855841 [Anastrepha ludens]
MYLARQQLWLHLPLLVLLIYFNSYVKFATAARSIYPDFHTDVAREVLRLSKSAEMRNYMQPQVDACVDFYRYSCGNWPKINPARFSDGKTGLFNVLKKAYNRRVVRLMREPKRTNESEMDRRVKYFFESCMNKAELRKNYRQKLLSVLEEFGGMPALKGAHWKADKFDWLEVVALILRKYGKQIVLGADILADLSNNEANRLYLGQLDKLVTSRATDYYVALALARQMEMQEVLGMSIELASKTATEIVEFEKRIAAGKLDANKGLGMEDKTQLTLLEVMTENYKPTLNFTHFVNVWLGHPYVLPVYVYVEQYLDNLRKVIEDTPKEIVANYIMWELLQDFRMEANNSNEKHQNRCVERTKRFFVKYLDYMTYQQLAAHNQHMNTEMQSLWLELKESFSELLQSESSDWMSEATRDKALEKLSAMSMEINSYERENFEELYGDLVIGTDEYFDNVINILEVRGRNYRLRLLEPPKLDEGETLSFTPAYAAEYNKVLIPVAFMQPLFLWDNAYPVTLKYSTIGFILAHEMAHGFDAIIRKYDARGNLNNWWDRNSTEEFVKRKECFKQQYSEYRYNGRKLPKTNAQDENIADNVGVRIAYGAFQKWLLQQSNNSTQLRAESLPNMDFTPRQLFFVSMAQVWCTDVNPNWRQIIIETDVHAPEEVRVVAMLSNFDQFALEFECRWGARMHPIRKCVTECRKKMFQNSCTQIKCLFTFTFLLILQQFSSDGAPLENTTAVPKDDLNTEWAKQIARQAKAAEIHVMLKTEVNPCEDFYQYACGNWHRNHPAQLLNHIMTDRFQLIATAFDRRLERILKEPRDDNALEVKVKNFYHACELVKKDDVRYRVALQHAYQEFGKMPMLDGEDWKEQEFNWWELVAKIQHKYGKQVILAVDIMADIANNTGNKVYIGPPDFSISSNTKIFSLLHELTTVEHMKRFFGVDDAKAKAIAKELINFERALVHGGSDSRLGLTLHDLLALKPVDKLREIYNESLDLQKFLELALGVDQVPETVYIYDEKYLLSIVQIVAETPQHVIANYIIWQMLQEYLVDVQKGDVAKWCIERTKKYFGKYVDYMVYQRYKDPAVEKEVFDVWEEVRETFHTELQGNKLDWIANTTRVYALEKLDAMQLYINSYESENFTAEYADVQIKRNNYVENVQQILQMESRKKLQRLHGPVMPLEAPEVLSFTPAYNILENNIKIPVALLQPRHFWGPHYPQALKYATLGYLIAHEMVHGFDDDGRNYDKAGNLHSWWDEKSTYQFEERRKCFQAQYHNYRYSGHQLPNDVSQAENIADNAGVKLAYEAYQRWLHAQRAANATNIEGRETFAQLNFDNQQLFFVGFAQLWCDDVQSFFRSAVAASDSHAPSMYRVIGALSNFQEFSWVFKCSQDAPMDPEFKCAIY